MKFNHSEFNEEMENIGYERPDMRVDIYLNEEFRERIDEIFNPAEQELPEKPIEIEDQRLKETDPEDLSKILDNIGPRIP